MLLEELMQEERAEGRAEGLTEGFVQSQAQCIFTLLEHLGANIPLNRLSVTFCTLENCRIVFSCFL